MSKALLHKKLEQALALIEELAALLAGPFSSFEKDMRSVRAAERNFQLIVDGMADISTHVLLDRGRLAPDTYRHAFKALARESIITPRLAAQLGRSAVLRNILVHEYDIEEDVRRFYGSAKASLPGFRAYIRALRAYAEKTKMA